MVVKLVIADMKVYNSVDYYKEEEEQGYYKWSLSVPSFVCTFPLCKRQ